MGVRGANGLKAAVVTTLFVLIFKATPTYAQAGPVLLKVGKWVGGQLIGYVTGKAIDQALGIDFEKELRQVEATLSAQIKQERADKEKLRVELAAARSTLEILGKLIRSKPQPGEIDGYRQQLAKDLEAVVAVQGEHDQRIVVLERQVRELNIRLRQLEVLPQPGVPFIDPSPAALAAITSEKVDPKTQLLAQLLIGSLAIMALAICL